MIATYISQPQPFQHTLKEGKNPKVRGHPNQDQGGNGAWQPPYWHGDKLANPYMNCMMNEPDGTRCYYDPVTQTYSMEHSAGHHFTHTTNGYIENIAGCKFEYIASGHSYTVNGHLDTNIGAHHRENIAGDHYENIQGVKQAFYQGGHTTHTVGNQNHYYGGSVKHSVAGVGPAGSWGVGVGPGDGTNHDNAITVDKNHMWIRAYTGSDITIMTKNNDIKITCGNTVTITTTADTVVNAGKNITLNAASTIIMTAPIIRIGDDDTTKQIYIGNGKQIIPVDGGGPPVPPFTVI